MKTLLSALTVILCVLPLSTARADETPAEVLRQAQVALDQGQLDVALRLANRAVMLGPRMASAYLLRGRVFGALARHAEAVTDFTRVLELDPRASATFNLRGAEQFKQGHIAESIADFDRFLAAKPEETAGHWMRGISYYYAGRFEDGRRQFARYEKVDTNDVENAIWHYLCNSRVVGKEKARSEMLKIGRDRRTPMMEVYALFQGRTKASDVLMAARAVPSEEQKQALFLAHLYLGLYADSQGDKPQAIEYLTQAVAQASVGGYMGDVARVHLMHLRKPSKSR